MKKIILSIILLFLIINISVANEIKGFINDEAEILNTQEEQQITQILQNLYEKDLAQVAIVTINSLEGQAIEALALEMAEGNLGTKDKNNGLLLLIAIEDRKYRFEVGRGLEPTFNDAKVGRYGRDFIIPAFKEQKYGDGILLTLNEINKELSGEEIPNLPTTQFQQTAEVNLKYKIISSLFFLIFIIIISFSARKKNSSKDNRYFLAAILASQMLRGGRGGGFGSGGFGGFGGGGSFGGGGAGGSF
jgi:uncharacterized protein